MGSSKDRPGGMDNPVPKNPTPTMSTPKPMNEMGTVAKVAAGKVDLGGRPGYKYPNVDTNNKGTS